MKPRELLNLSLYQFDLLSQGYDKRREIEWMHTREIMAMINNTSPYCKNIDPKKLVPLSIDKLTVEDESKSIALFEQLVSR